MRAGPLRHRVSIQQQTRTPDGMGGYVEGWTELASIRAEFAIPSGRIANVAQQLDAVVSAEVRIRHRPDITAGMRLVHDGTTYRIEAVLLDNNRRMSRLMCSSIENP